MEISPPFSTGVEKLVEMTSAVVKMGGYRRRASRAAYIPSTDCKRVISTGNTQQSGVLKGEISLMLPHSFLKSFIFDRKHGAARSVEGRKLLHVAGIFHQTNLVRVQFDTKKKVSTL